MGHRDEIRRSHVSITAYRCVHRHGLRLSENRLFEHFRSEAPIWSNAMPKPVGVDATRGFGQSLIEKATSKLSPPLREAFRRSEFLPQ